MTADEQLPAEQVIDQPPTRLVYAEDVTAGMVVALEQPCAHTNMFALMGGAPHEHGWSYCSVLERRDKGGIVSVILVDESGEQRPAVWHELTLVRIRV